MSRHLLDNKLPPKNIMKECNKCRIDISSYEIYEDYRIDGKKLCEECWLEKMNAIPLEKLAAPNFTNTITI